MYSVVLMAALTAGSAAPDCHRCGCCGWGGGWCGCYGGWGGCYGCYGGCFGCFGGCYGCWGGWGGWGCGGCMGTYYGAPTYPGSVFMGSYAPPPGAGQGQSSPTTPYGEPLPPATEEKKGKGKGTMLPANKAKLIVELPANAKLFIDDMPMKNVSGVRSFNTPTLEPGQAYYYMVRVEIVRDGKPVSQTRRVIVRAGQVARADFKDLESDAVQTAQAK